MTLGNLAIVEKKLGNLAKAKEMYERVLKIKELHYGSKDIAPERCPFPCPHIARNIYHAPAPSIHHRKYVPPRP